MGVEHQLVQLALALVGLAHHRHPGGVGAVALPGGAEIQQHQVARLQPAAGGAQVGLGRVGAGLHDGFEGGLSAFGAHQRGQDHPDLDLGLARVHGLHDLAGNGVGDGGGAAQPLQFLRRLQQPEAAQRLTGIHQPSGAQPLGDGDREVALLHRQLLGPADGLPHQLVRVLAVAPAQNLDPARTGLRTLALQAGNDQQSAPFGDPEAHQALVGIGVEACQVRDRNRIADVGGVCTLLPYPRSETEKRGPRKIA